MSQTTIPEPPAAPRDFTVRRSYRELVVDLVHLPIRDRRFWAAQAMVVAIFVVHIGIYLVFFHHGPLVPNFTLNLLLFIPIIYAGDVFGLVGSLSAVLTGIPLTILDELLIHHSAVEFWGEWGVLVIAIVVAIQVGHQYKNELYQRKQIAQSNELFRDAFDKNTSGMFLLDREGRFINVNRTFGEMIGYSVDELLGRTPNEFTHPDDAPLINEHCRRLAEGGRHSNHSMRYLHRNGGVVFGEVSLACLTDEAGQPTVFIVSVHDITDERALLAELEHQALYDPLTGLANRTLFEDRLSRARASVARDGGGRTRGVHARPR